MKMDRECMGHTFPIHFSNEFNKRFHVAGLPAISKSYARKGRLRRGTINQLLTG